MTRLVLPDGRTSLLTPARLTRYETFRRLSNRRSFAYWNRTADFDRLDRMMLAAWALFSVANGWTRIGGAS